MLGTVTRNKPNQQRKIYLTIGLGSAWSAITSTCSQATEDFSQAMKRRIYFTTASLNLGRQIINSIEGMLKTIILLRLSTICDNKRNKLIRNTNQGSRSTIKRIKTKTIKLPSRRAREAMEVTPSVESMVDTGKRNAD